MSNGSTAIPVPKSTATKRSEAVTTSAGLLYHLDTGEQTVDNLLSIADWIVAEQPPAEPPPPIMTLLGTPDPRDDGMRVFIKGGDRTGIWLRDGEQIPLIDTELGAYGDPNAFLEVALDPADFYAVP